MRKTGGLEKLQKYFSFVQTVKVRVETECDDDNDSMRNETGGVRLECSQSNFEELICDQSKNDTLATLTVRLPKNQNSFG